jgi:PTS system fructose-specific IIA component
VTAEEFEAIVDPACVLMNIGESTFDGCLRAFETIVRTHPAVIDPANFLERVRLREAAVSTASADQVAFPHARTDAVFQLFLAIGRSESGILFRPDLPPVHLVFLIGTPPDAIADYLACLAWLVRRVRNPETRRALMLAETPEVFLKTIATAGS